VRMPSRYGFRRNRRGVVDQDDLRAGFSEHLQIDQQSLKQMVPIERKHHY